MSVTTRPSVRVSCRLSARATPEGWYPKARAAAITRSRVAGRARALPDRMRLTVAVETPDRAATSVIVTAMVLRRRHRAAVPALRPSRLRAAVDTHAWLRRRCGAPRVRRALSRPDRARPD